MAIKPRPAPAAAKPAVSVERGVAPKNVQAKETVANATSPKGEVTKTLETREFSEKPCNLGITRSFTVKRDDDFIKVGLSINMPCTVQELTSGEAAKAIQELLKEFIEAEATEAMAQYTELTGNEPEAGEEGEATEEGEAEGEAETSEEDSGEQLTSEGVMELPDRKAVVQAIREYGLEIDPNDFAKTKAGTAEMKQAIIDAYFSEEDAAEGEAEGEETEEAELTEDDIRAMKRPELIALIQQNELEVDPSKHPKIAALQDAIIDALAALANADEMEAEGGEEVDEGDASQGYSEEDLAEMSLDDLKEIYNAWGMGKFPAGPPKVAANLARKAILKAQGTEEE